MVDQYVVIFGLVRNPNHSTIWNSMKEINSKPLDPVYKITCFFLGFIVVFLFARLAMGPLTAWLFRWWTWWAFNLSFFNLPLSTKMFSSKPLEIS